MDWRGLARRRGGLERFVAEAWRFGEVWWGRDGREGRGVASGWICFLWCACMHVYVYINIVLSFVQYVAVVVLMVVVDTVLVYCAVVVSALVVVVVASNRIFRAGSQHIYIYIYIC